MREEAQKELEKTLMEASSEEGLRIEHLTANLVIAAITYLAEIKDILKGGEEE